MQKLTGYLKNYKKEFILGPAFKLIEAVFELFVPVVMAKIVDVGIAGADKTYVVYAGLLLLGLALAGLAFAATAQYLAAKASQGFGTDLRNALFARVNAMPFDKLDAIGASSMITRVNTDVNQVQTGAAMFIRLVLRAPFLIVGAITMSMIIDWRLGLVFLAAAPLITLALWLIMSKAVPYYKTLQKKLDKTTDIARENLDGVRVVRAYCAENRETERFNKAAGELSRAAIGVGGISALLNPVASLVMNGAVIAIIWFGGIRVNVGSLTQGELIAFVNYAAQIILSLVVAANLTVIFTKASASAARIREALAVEPEPRDGRADFDKNAGVRFENVSFSYAKNGKYALKNLDFEIKSGQTVGIIGGTGSGKSTIASLLSRFYLPDEGKISVFGLDLKECALDEYRKRVALVPQKSTLFSGTLRDNMLMGKRDATDGEIRAALRLAQADFADDLDKPVVRGGKNFSGGQRQRLCIARALLKPADLLILDDSSSALDYATDAALRENLKSLDGKTAIIISQRITSIKDCDKILVLENGTAAGFGSHEELLSCPAYREICQSQTREAL